MLMALHIAAAYGEQKDDHRTGNQDQRDHGKLRDQFPVEARNKVHLNPPKLTQSKVYKVRR